MQQYVYKKEEEKKIKKIVYDFLGSDYMRKILDYDVDFLAFAGDIDKRLTKDIDDAMLTAITEDELAEIKEFAGRPAFRDEHLQMLFKSTRYSLIFGLADIIYVLQGKDFIYKFMDNEDGKASLIEDFRKTDGYSETSKRIIELHKKLWKFEHPAIKLLESLFRYEPEIEITPILQFEKENQILYLVLTRDVKYDRANMRKEIHLFDEKEVYPIMLETAINYAFDDFGLSYRENLMTPLGYGQNL